MSYNKLYSNIQTCPDYRCDRYARIENNDVIIPKIAATKVYPKTSCNYEKQCGINSRIYDRNLAYQSMEIIPDYRSEYKQCGDTYINKNMIRPQNLENNINNFRNVQNTVEQGKGNMIRYLKNIDIDTQLRLFHYPYSLCDEPKHHKPPCPDGCFVCDDMCRPDAIKSLKNSDLVSNEKPGFYVPIRNMNLPDSCVFKKQNMIDVNITREYPQYKPLSGCECVSLPIRITDENSDKRKKYDLLVPSSYTTDMNPAPVLVVGPERCDRQINNLWNNNTKRRFISDTLEHYM
jgi:hypothetical protein